MIRTLFAVMLLCLGAPPALAADAGKLDDQNGYRGIEFGTSPDSVEGFEFVSDRGAGGTEIYTLASEPLELGDATLDAVTYGYFDDKLYFVALFTSGRGNGIKALAALEERYGKGTPVFSEAKEYVWHGRHVTLHFREDSATHMGMIGFTSVSLAAQVRARIRSVANQAVP